MILLIEKLSVLKGLKSMNNVYRNIFLLTVFSCFSRFDHLCPEMQANEIQCAL